MFTDPAVAFLAHAHSRMQFVAPGIGVCRHSLLCGRPLAHAILHNISRTKLSVCTQLHDCLYTTTRPVYENIFLHVYFSLDRLQGR